MITVDLTCNGIVLCIMKLRIKQSASNLWIKWFKRFFSFVVRNVLHNFLLFSISRAPELVNCSILCLYLVGFLKAMLRCQPGKCGTLGHGDNFSHGSGIWSVDRFTQNRTNAVLRMLVLSSDFSMSFHFKQFAVGFCHNLPELFMSTLKLNSAFHEVILVPVDWQLATRFHLCLGLSLTCWYILYI